MSKINIAIVLSLTFVNIFELICIFFIEDDDTNDGANVNAGCFSGHRRFLV